MNLNKIVISANMGLFDNLSHGAGENAQIELESKERQRVLSTLLAFKEKLNARFAGRHTPTENLRFLLENQNVLSLDDLRSRWSMVAGIDRTTREAPEFGKLGSLNANVLLLRDIGDRIKNSVLMKTVSSDPELAQEFLKTDLGKIVEIMCSALDDYRERNQRNYR